MKKCPYCKSEMLPGSLPGESSPIFWVPEEKRSAIFTSRIPDIGILLKPASSQPGVFSSHEAEAYYCPKCKIVLASAVK